MKKSVSGMRKGAFYKASYIGLAMLLVISCSEEINPSYTPEVAQNNPSLITGAKWEDFEDGTKTSYIAADAKLFTGVWRLSDALIGTSTADHKYEGKALRIINTGSARMEFDFTTGADTVLVSHAIYGDEGDSKWSLWVSTDKGANYTQVGESVTTSSASLDQVAFKVSKGGNVRFEIRRESGSAKGLNIDDVQVLKYTGTTTPGDGGNNGGGDNGGGDEPVQPDNSNYLFGNPSHAINDLTSANNYLFDKTNYIMSYNKDRGTPNWVSWHLDQSNIGSSGRTENFTADTSLPAAWYHVSDASYEGSGFDRGHNCPSGDRTSSAAVNETTFLMSNMIPQAPNNNQKAWATFENFIRAQLSGTTNEAYVIMGNYGQGGEGKFDTPGVPTLTIDNGHVTVPSHVWKVVVILPTGSNDISRVSAATRIIAIDTPNKNSVGNDWWTYRTSVDAIEAVTGYDILSALPDAVENTVESNVDTGSYN